MSSPWRSEFQWLVMMSFIGFFLGKITGFWLASFGLSVLVYLFRHLHHINKISVWLRLGGRIPQGSGIWEEIYYLIYRLRKRNKTRKKRLIHMLERFRTATAALPDATVVLNSRDEIDWFNDAAERLLGLRRGDVGQQIVNLLRSPKFAEYLKSPSQDVSLNIKSPMPEKADLEMRIVPYGDELRLLIVQDVTKLRFMERVRSDFVANVSHELRTPLTVLRGYVETMLDDEGNLPDRYQKIFSRMEEQTQRMQNLIDGLLALTKLESGSLAINKLVKSRPFIESICEEAGHLKGPDQILQLDIESKADLLGSPDELRSAFSNLLVNAFKYSPADGVIRAAWQDRGDGAVFEVSDNGPGIAQEHIPRLTERFYRVESGKTAKESGVGLGLAIVKHVMNRHEGNLLISSKLGEGSCFCCKFPEKRLVRS